MNFTLLLLALSLLCLVCDAFAASATVMANSGISSLKLVRVFPFYLSSTIPGIASTPVIFFVLVI
jgi:hypothetical protein